MTQVIYDDQIFAEFNLNTEQRFYYSAMGSTEMGSTDIYCPSQSALSSQKIIRLVTALKVQSTLLRSRRKLLPVVPLHL